MTEIVKKLVNKQLVHKSNKENVLIYNIRRALPVRINKDIFEDVILNNLSKREKTLISRYYTLHHNEKKDLLYYLMYNIPHVIKVEHLKKLINEREILKEELKELLKYYQRDPKKKYYIIKEGLTEIEEIYISKIFKKKDIQLFDYDNREKISKIFERTACFHKEDIYFGNMFVDSKHSFFFEHEVDHVPAIMLMEAARQFFIAVCHIYGKLPFDDVSFILSGIQAEFYGYLELNYPVKLILKVNELKKKKDCSWNKIDTDIFVFQNNIKAAVINYSGRTISNEIFKKIRMQNFNHKVHPRFNPSGMYYRNVSIKFKNKKFLFKINDISESGFQLEVNDEFVNNIEKECEFYIFFQEIGFIHGKCDFKWHKKNRGGYKGEKFTAGFKIIEIDDSDRKNLKSAIKKYCFVKTGREYL